MAVKDHGHIRWMARLMQGLDASDIQVILNWRAWKHTVQMYNPIPRAWNRLLMYHSQ